MKILDTICELCVFTWTILKYINNPNHARISLFIAGERRRSSLKLENVTGKQGQIAAVVHNLAERRNSLTKTDVSSATTAAAVTDPTEDHDSARHRSSVLNRIPDNVRDVTVLGGMSLRGRRRYLSMEAQTTRSAKFKSQYTNYMRLKLASLSPPFALVPNRSSEFLYSSPMPMACSRRWSRPILIRRLSAATR